ncbi:MAG: TerC/Alx family metal homeostasis membrane protein [Pseudobdellovibrionaceae bacterium]
MDQLLTFMSLSVLDAPVWAWLGFFTAIFALLLFDLGVLNRKDHAIGLKESITLTLFYIFLATLFGIWVWWYFGSDEGIPYFTAYLVEKSLSLDNIFVMSVIFGYYQIPLAYQHRVLFWGIIGVLVLRGVVIGVGTYIVAQFSWILYVFGALLVYTGIRIMLTDDDDAPDIEDSTVRKFLSSHFHITTLIEGNRFLIRKTDSVSGKKSLHLTPLFMALITIEFADLLFAMDSIPAVLAITDDTFVVFTSNIFAILGLRAMYFMLAALLERFKYLKYALSIVLVFIGGKIFYTLLVGHIEPIVSLGVTVFVLIGGGILSFMKTAHEKP